MTKFIEVAAVCAATTSMVLVGCKDDDTPAPQPKTQCADMNEDTCKLANSTKAGCKWNDGSAAGCTDSDAFTTMLDGNKTICDRFSGSMRYRLADKDCGAKTLTTLAWSTIPKVVPPSTLSYTMLMPVADAQTGLYSAKPLNDYKRCQAAVHSWDAAKKEVTMETIHNADKDADDMCKSGYYVTLTEEQFATFKVLTAESESSCTSNKCVVDSFSGSSPKCVTQHALCDAAAHDSKKCDKSICEYSKNGQADHSDMTCVVKDDFIPCNQRYSTDKTKVCAANTDKDCVPAYCEIANDKKGNAITECIVPASAHCQLNAKKDSCQITVNSQSMDMSDDADVKQMCTFHNKGDQFCYGNIA